MRTKVTEPNQNARPELESGRASGRRDGTAFEWCTLVGAQCRAYLMPKSSQFRTIAQIRVVRCTHAAMAKSLVARGAWMLLSGDVIGSRDA